jgi:hypothetical protein
MEPLEPVYTADLFQAARERAAIVGDAALAERLFAARSVMVLAS